MLITNAFSVNMLDAETDHKIVFMPIGLEEVKSRIALHDGEIESAIGHPGTAVVLSARLGMDVPFNRSNVSLSKGGNMIVAQVFLPRLAEGQVLSEAEVAEVKINFWFVSSAT